ncbi:MAG: hypothetical protein C5B60_05525 [Chloroflexi bacterium]|nr:MAG: hypothetical protein C5B60_05525 [Chloroflexota bacterium]
MARNGQLSGPLTAYSLTFAACRDLGHAWLYQRWDGNRREREIVCSNCGAKRTDAIDAGWRVERRWYSYPKDYRIGSDLEIDVAIEARRLLSRLAQSKHIRWAREGG